MEPTTDSFDKSSFQQKSIEKEFNEVMEIFNKMSKVISMPNPEMNYLHMLELESSELQTMIDEKVRIKKEFVESDIVAENEEKLKKIFTISNVIKYHKMLLHKTEVQKEFHFCDTSNIEPLKRFMKLYELINLILSNYSTFSSFQFNAILFALSETEEYIDQLFIEIKRRLANVNLHQDTMNFLKKWIEATPELFASPNYMEFQKINKYLANDAEYFITIARDIAFLPIYNTPIVLNDYFDIRNDTVENTINDFYSNIKPIFAPETASISGFSDEDVAEALTTIAVLNINLVRPSLYIRKNTNGISLWSSVCNVAVADSVLHEFGRTLGSALSDPSKDDSQIVKIMERFLGIRNCCIRKNMDFLSSMFTVRTADFESAITKRFGAGSVGRKLWEEISTFKVSIPTAAEFMENPHGLPMFPRFNTDVVHLKDAWSPSGDSIQMDTPLKIAAICDVVLGSQRCIESKPMSMKMLYSVLFFMLKDLDDYDKRRTISLSK